MMINDPELKKMAQDKFKSYFEGLDEIIENEI